MWMVTLITDVTTHLNMTCFKSLVFNYSHYFVSAAAWRNLNTMEPHVTAQLQ